MANVGVKPSFIVEFWSRVFDLLSWLSPFKWVRCLFPRARQSYMFVDSWVSGHLLLSAVMLAVLHWSGLRWWEAIFLVYGGLRVFEVVIYQVNVLLFDEYRTRKRGEKYALRGYRRIVTLLLMNYGEIIFWFALFYRNLDWHFNSSGVVLNSFLQSLNLSFVTMTTFGFTSITPHDGFANVLVFIHSAIGLFMVLLVLARFIAVLPQPESMDEIEKEESSSPRG